MLLYPPKTNPYLPVQLPNMIYAILGDIHGNLEALEAVLEDAKAYQVEAYISTGDLVGYGADPSACVELIQSLNAEVVMGNHDLRATQCDLWSRFPFSRKTTASWTHEQLTKSQRRWLRSRPLVQKKGEVTCVHASLHEPANWNYVLDTKAAQTHFRNQLTPICFIGHSHIPIAYLKKEQIYAGLFDTLIIPSDAQVLVNVGSVGQPRDHDPRASYCLYDDVKRTITLRRIPYTISLAQKKIRAAGLPFKNAMRLEKGR